MAKHEPPILWPTKARARLLKVLADSTQAEVAGLVGCAQQNVSQWAKGRSRPSQSAREALERLYGIPVTAWLVAGERAHDSHRVSREARAQREDDALSRGAA